MLFPRHSPGAGFLFILALAWIPPSPARAADSWSLDSCITRALARNPELVAARHDLDAAHERIRQARALEPPSLSFEAGKLGTPVSNEEREASWRLSQGLPFPGQRGRAANVATRDAELVGSERDAAKLRIRGEVTRAYRRLQADVLTLEVLQGLHGTTQGIEDLTSARLASGAARYLDVLRARVERARLDNDLIEAQRSWSEHRRTLNFLMSREPDAELSLADSLAFVPLRDSLSRLLDDARRSRPGLRAAEILVRREEAALALASANRLPAPEIAAGMDRVPGSSTPGFGASVALTMPFVPWSDRGARIGEARAVAGRARTRYESAQRRLDAAVRTAYEASRAAEAQVLRFDRALLRDALDAVSSATRGYQFGQLDGTDLFESLRTLRTVQLERIRALLNYELALVDLQSAE